MAHFRFLSSLSSSFFSFLHPEAPLDSSSRYSSVYCLKALGAFFVVCIHCGIGGPFYPIIRTAVPFFFMISGYFIYRDDTAESINRCISSLKKIAWLTLYANIFYYLCYFFPERIIPFSDFKDLLSGIFIGNNFGGHLWYLTSYIEVLILVIAALRFRFLTLLWWLIPVFAVTGLLLGKYAFLLPLPDWPDETYFMLNRNFLTMGVPCFGIGWLMRKYRDALLRAISLPIALTLMLLILSVSEIWCISRTGELRPGDYIVTTLPLAASMLLVALKFPRLGADSLVEKIGKNYSTYIYIFHIFILRICFSVSRTYFHIAGFVITVVAFIFTLLFSMIWLKAGKVMSR